MKGLGFGLRIRAMTTVVVVAAMMTLMRTELGNANMVYVGGSKISWTPNVNLSDWFSHQTFYTADWLYFGYEKNRYNVLEVNKTSYEKCIDKDFISNVTGGAGRDVFQLTEPKTYYFLSSGGYCFQGLKVAVDVRRPIPPTPPPTSRPASSASTVALSPLLLSLLLLGLLSVCSSI